MERTRPAIKSIGLGEPPDDLQFFDAKPFAQAWFDLVKAKPGGMMKFLWDFFLCRPK